MADETKDLKGESVGAGAAAGGAMGAAIAVLAVSSGPLSPFVGAALGGLVGSFAGREIYRQTHPEPDVGDRKAS